MQRTENGVDFGGWCHSRKRPLLAHSSSNLKKPRDILGILCFHVYVTHLRVLWFVLFFPGIKDLQIFLFSCQTINASGKERIGNQCLWKLIIIHFNTILWIRFGPNNIFTDLWFYKLIWNSWAYSSFGSVLLRAHLSECWLQVY